MSASPTPPRIHTLLAEVLQESRVACLVLNASAATLLIRYDQAPSLTPYWEGLVILKEI